VAEQHLWLEKAQRSLLGAESEFASQRYDNVANRAYYACFQSAVAALIDAGKRSTGGKGTWSHSVAQAMFSQELIHRRKVYPAELSSILSDVFSLRQQADYTTTLTSEARAKRTLDKARRFVEAVRDEVMEDQ